jgi:DNA-3-methyladenine glycosylase
MSVVDAAKALIGCTLEHEDAVGVIVETEAYHDTEPACHAFIGETPRSRVLFEAPGRLYVYRSYGIHALANIVVEPAGVGAAVLLRALEPIEGLEVMALRRGRTRPRDLCSGPGKLTQALGIELIHNDTSVRGSSRGRGSGSPRPPTCRGGSPRPRASTCRGRGRPGCACLRARRRARRPARRPARGRAGRASRAAARRASSRSSPRRPAAPRSPRSRGPGRRGRAPRARAV